MCERRAQRSQPLTRSIGTQAREAVGEADLVLFVVDAQIGITPGDEEVAQILRESHRPVLVLANKIDDPRQDTLALELHRLGLGDPIPISGLHGHGVVDQDLAVADVARKADCSTLVVLSKWDATQVNLEDVRRQVQRRLRQRPAFIAISAHTGRGLERLLDTVAELFDRYAAKVPTPELNNALADLSNAREPPSKNGKRLNMLYGAQIHERPPRFRIFVNDPSLVTRDYGYWVENELRERFGLDGVPVSIDFVRRS